MDKTIESIKDQFTFFAKYFETVEKLDEVRQPLSLDQMAKRARQLAAIHRVTYKDSHELLLNNLTENEAILLQVHEQLLTSVKNKQSVTPAAEWILDNFYLIDEQIQLGKKYLPKGYSRGLPKLITEEGVGLPRVLEIVSDIIRFSDAHTDVHSLNNFINAYQEKQELTLGELWAVPIMLRFALIDNLKKVAIRIMQDRMHNDLGAIWANRVIASSDVDSSKSVVVLADMANLEFLFNSAFVTEFHKRVHAGVAGNSLANTFLEQKLASRQLSITQLIHDHAQQLAQAQVSAANSINSLRFLSKLDWREFVESVSLVERTLREDSNGVYNAMDFQTRDLYRHQIEEIAKQCEFSENDIARIAVDLSKDSARHEKLDKRAAHVGFFLIGKGRSILETFVKVKPPLKTKLAKAIRHNWDVIYFLLYTIITLSLTTFLMNFVSGFDWGALINGVFFLLTLVVSMQSTSVIVNWVSTIIIPPALLPKMDYTNGIPSEAKTMIAVPTIIINRNQVERLVKDLEVRYLGNKTPALLFGLLTDFEDSDVKIRDEEAELLNYLEDLIRGLNQKYCLPSEDQFFLFHRPRLWNEGEQKWMGHERKRGKLRDLNHVLRGSATEKFMSIIGAPKQYQGAKYVISLDTDTQLPRDSAAKLIGIMEHPLNTASVDEASRIVTDGYGIIQPRVAISLHNAARSLYSKLNENDIGIDPYTGAVSDVYQDVFKEGSYIGKGIYNVDVFEKCLDNRFPDNNILSHDLLEGSYIRCAYASDVQLYEENLSSYVADVNRRHRWIRGDWQIAQWIFNRVPSNKRSFVTNPISGLSKWKIFDNLRRSFVPIALTFLLILGLTVLHTQSKFLIALGCVVFVPVILSFLWNTFQKSKHVSLSAHIKSILEEFGKSVASLLLTIIFAPYEATIHLDAVVKALWRMMVSKKNRLQWVPSSLTKPKLESIKWIIREMIYCVLAGIFLFTVLIFFKPSSLVLGISLAACWTIAPLVAYKLSLPVKSQPKALNVAEKKYLRKLARKTWAFYDHIFSQEDNWLPPDNIQQYPIAVTAHRTSPTNIGITLLANLSAYDFGYLTVDEMIARTKKTFATLHKLERYKGHFFNWYDTQTLNVLLPRYISTVDSGNFIGYILTLKHGLQELKSQPILRKDFHQGLQDVADIIYHSRPDEMGSEIEIFKKQIDALSAFHRISVTGWRNYLKLVTEYFTPIEEKAINHRDADFQDWIRSFRKQLDLLEEEINFLLPWENLLSKVPLAIQHEFSELPSLEEIVKATIEIRSCFESTDTNANGELIFGLIDDVTTNAINRLADIDGLSTQCSEFSDVAFDFLYDKSHRLLTIGYNADNHQRDSSYYDLLASEARLSSFVGIAQGKVPQESWFALGRRLTIVNGTPTLMSWSGSMFEYLMPLLVMPSYENTLLHETHLGSVKMQIQFADKIGIPWGISESCYNVVDSHLTYQYKAFGVPDLGFKRGLDKEFVIAPYATVMALMVEPKKAFDNLMRMQRLGYEGKYGFYEAVEHTPSRLPRSKQPVVIQTFMAHHQGMGLLALNFLLNEQPMQRRFQADPQLQTALLLLQERSPKALTAAVAIDESEEIVHTSIEGEFRIIDKLDTPVPEIQLLSNGNYHVMLTQSGSGFSRWKNIAVTRWREDATRDHLGTFFYVTDLNTGEFFSTAYHPTLIKGGAYEAIFSQGRAEFRRNELNLECHTEVVVSPEDDVELRRIRITNSSDLSRSIAVTTYSEIVIAPQAADAAHPAFSNLFVQTQIHDQSNAIIATRRARANDESPPWSFSLLRSSSHVHEADHYETDRLKFIGRGNTLVRPKGILDGVLTNSQGSVLDPVAVIQSRFTIGPGERLIVDYVAGAAASRVELISLVEKFQDQHLRNRAFDLSWTYSQVALRQINSSESQAQLFTKIASSILYHNPRARAGRDILQRNIMGQAGLWRYSISGDLPIVLLVISDINEISLITQLIQARTYWELKGISVDLVILNEDRSGYRQVLQEHVHNLVNAIPLSNARERQGAVFVCSSDGMPADDIVLLHSVARVVFKDNGHSLAEQLHRHFHDKSKHFDSILVKSVRAATHTMRLPENGLFNNGYGCFSEDGTEYIIKVDTETITPLPWVNVIANKTIGTLISESGHCYTWFENAQMFRLSPWSNDPVADATGELFYIRDDDNGQYWSPTPWPRQSGSDYLIKHGFGYTSFEHTHDNLFTSLTTFVDTDDPVKFSRIIIRNQSGRLRKISLISYIEWVLGTLRGQNNLHVVTELTSNGILARNPYNSDFPGYVAFCKMLGDNLSITCDRREFLGRNGTYESPKALHYKTLGKNFGAGLDPCTAIMTSIELLAGEECEIVFMVGAERDRNKAENLLQKYDHIEAVKSSHERSIGFWKTMLGSVQVETPDPAINLLANGWLTYQVLSCRFWGRSGFYQSGGAFGFRDQLQDSIALLHTDPLLTREQILKSASRQFIEGDVQHWWHPPTNRGVRTLCSDDFLWLPYATSRYVEATGDYSILTEQVPFITGRSLAAHEESYYDQPIVTPQTSTLYDHCKLAIERAISHKGIHGLPLMGSGDWNDGMNMVGIEGKGESTWLGFFLYDVINRFISIMDDQSDDHTLLTFKQEAASLKTNLNLHGWNGKWYLRAYFDDGQALGVPGNDECKIDSIAQSWSLLSGAGEYQKTVTALDAAYTFLVNREKSIIQLLDPPFDKSAMNPGYIKGYVPGVRENGGQYTHAAIWLVMAFAQQKNIDRMWSLLEIINPINHGSSKEKQDIYKVEPYVLAADVYGVDPHTGRGGWTWYTGSAGWMYQLILESVLGVRRKGDKIEISPCIPEHWRGFKVRYNCRHEQFDIQVNCSQKGTWDIIVNGVQLVDNTFHVQVQPAQNHPTVP